MFQGLRRALNRRSCFAKSTALTPINVMVVRVISAQGPPLHDRVDAGLAERSESARSRRVRRRRVGTRRRRPALQLRQAFLRLLPPARHSLRLRLHHALHAQRQLPDLSQFTHIAKIIGDVCLSQRGLRSDVRDRNQSALTVVPKDRSLMYIPGQVSEISFFDIRALNRGYCSSSCADTETSCEHGGYSGDSLSFFPVCSPVRPLCYAIVKF